MVHRPDIDGLRAVAVLPVVFFHAGVAPFSGGFVGVDVFFVISGYLITGIIAHDIRAGRFSLVDFYERRARRILPALVAVTAASLAGGWLIMTPPAFEGLARSALATMLFAANIYFWQSLDYFSTAADFLPLLHTWSLAVEEQFYLLWPLCLLLAATQTTQRLAIAIVMAAALSLAASIVLTPVVPQASFYLLPTRAWELLAGALLAIGVLPALRRGWPAEITALAGLALVLGSMVAFDVTTPFPGAAAILPVAGTAMLIHAAPGTRVGRILSIRPIVLIGLISYSLYLWHWPLLAGLRIVHGTVDLPPVTALAAILLSIALAGLSWRFIEQPFRDRRRIARTAIFALSGTTIAAMIAASALVITGEGMPGRLNGEVTAMADGARDVDPDRFACIDRLPADGLCEIGSRHVPPSVLVWGDSHANALKSAFDDALKGAGKAGVIASHRACAPLTGVRRQGYGARACTRFNNAVLDWLEARGAAIDTLIITARWPLSVSGMRVAGEAGAKVVLISNDEPDGAVGNRALVRRGLAATLHRARHPGRRIILLGSVPAIGWDVPTTLVARARLGLDPPPAPEANEVGERHGGADAILEAMALRPDTEFIPLWPDFCTPRCAVMRDRRPLYVDDNHLSMHGARAMVAGTLSKRIFGF